jgi:hypothetical protein
MSNLMKRSGRSPGCAAQSWTIASGFVSVLPWAAAVLLALTTIMPPEPAIRPQDRAAPVHDVSAELHDLAVLAAAAYDGEDIPMLARLPPGWRPLRPQELGPVGGGAFDRAGYFVHGNAAAFAAVSARTKTLALVLRGSDQAIDVIDALFAQAAHYDRLRPFVESVVRYADRNAAMLRRLYVTGHSLGGALAEQFAVLQGTAAATPNEVPTTVVTFGSPGLLPAATAGAGNPSSGMVRIALSRDPIAGWFSGAGGVDLRIPMTDVGPLHASMGSWAVFMLELRRTIGLPTEHDIARYADVIGSMTIARRATARPLA